jgi:hypothetical protein
LSRAWLAAVLCACFASAARAQLAELPDSLPRAALSAHKATAHAPADLDGADFALDRAAGEGAEAFEIEAAIEPGSVRFVRVAAQVVVPRGVVHVRVPGARGGVVEYAGTTQPLVHDRAGASAAADIPIALLSDKSEALVVRALFGERELRARYHVRYAPRPENAARVMLDSSCSPWGINIVRGSLPSDSYLHLGCRLIRTARADVMGATLEIYALFDNAGSDVALSGVRLSETRGALYVLRLESSPGHVTLEARGHALTLSYAVPPTLPSTFIGAGVGPYHYLLRDGQRQADVVIPLVTLYAGYTFTPDVRIVYFNATALHRRGYADNGLYLWIEQARMMDDRLSFNLLLGANALVYSHRDKVEWRMTAPQGFELVYRDLFMRNRSGMLGAFLYPDLFDRSYYNVWLRWGSPQLFGELNYIHWKQPHSTGVTSSTSVGISFGMPIARFL